MRNWLETLVELSGDIFSATILTADHEELAAAEAFNREMAELEDLEQYEELRLVLQDRINSEMKYFRELVHICPHIPTSSVATPYNVCPVRPPL